jgi:hypothetical protein
MKQKFNIKWSLTVKLLTIAVLLIAVYGEYLLIKPLFYSLDWMKFFFSLLLPAVIIYCAMNSPLSVEINDNSLTVHKIIGRNVFYYNQIKQIGQYKPNGSEIRIFGSGGFLGYIGKFKNSEIGTYQSYAGDFGQAILIQTKDENNFVISCEDYLSVIHSVKNKII